MRASDSGDGTFTDTVLFASYPHTGCGFLKTLVRVATVLLLALALQPRARSEDALPGGDLERIRGQLRAYYLTSISNSSEEIPLEFPAVLARKWAAALGADGFWSDIDYSGNEKGFWPAASHLKRTCELAKASELATGPEKAALDKAARASFDAWLGKDGRSTNWWHNEIGVPRNVAEVMLLLGPELTPDETGRGLKIVERATVCRTGQNRVWEAGIVLERAVLQGDAALARTARDAIAASFNVTTGEGVQSDFSFHQHGPQLQMGNYGLAFAVEAVKWVEALRGTGLALGQAETELLRAYLLEGESYFTRNGVLDVNALERQLFPGAQEGKSQTLAELFTRLPVHQVALSGAGPARNKHFWRSDVMVEQASGYSVSVRMSSRRVIGTETVNGENLRGYYLADGATYIYRTGHEYDEIFPVWNWRQIPGVTCAQEPDGLPAIKRSNDHVATDFAGGVSDGEYGAASMSYSRDGVAGSKSWFFLDGAMACLGAGLASDGDAPVATCVNQCLLHGDVLASGGGPLAPGTHSYTHLEWAWHDGVGYLFPEPMNVTLRAGPQSGAWNEVYTAGARGRLQRDVFSAVIVHGTKFQDGRYSYIVKPDVSAAAMPALAGRSGIQILSNTKELQAVRDPAAGLTMAAFLQPGVLAGAGGTQVKVSTPCLLILKEKASMVVVSDPTAKLTACDVTLDGATQTVLLPTGGDAGKSVTLTFQTAPHAH